MNTGNELHTPEQVAPGSKAWISREFADVQGRSFRVSVGVIRGRRPGAVFANVAGQHGMEHIGPLVLRDLFDEIDPEELSGTLLLCPCANPLALLQNFEVHPEREKLPELGSVKLTYESLGVVDRVQLGDYNMNRLWPDDIAGPEQEGEGVAQRITRWLWRTMIAPADMVLDHHSVKRSLKPYVFAEEPALAWTPLLGCEGVWCTGPLQPAPMAYPYRRLCMQSLRQGKVGICIEYSRQFELCESDRPLGRFAVLNVMRALGMIAGAVEMPRPVWLIEGPYWEGMEEVKATALGHVHFYAQEYQQVAAGQLLARICDLQTQQTLQEVRAPYDCLFLHSSFDPIARPGSWLCRLQKRVRLLAQAGQPYAVPPLPRRDSARA